MRQPSFFPGLTLFTLAFAFASASAETPAKPEPTVRISLWPGKAPVDDGTFEDCSSELQVFLPSKEKANGAAIVLCPGGGYIRHVTDREGYPIATWLNEHGIATIILEYRLPKQRHQVPLLDAQRAIRVVNTGVLAAPAADLKRWLAQVGNRNSQGEYYLTDVYALAAAEGRPAACARCGEAGEADGANDPWQLAQLERRLQQRHARALALAGVRLADPLRYDQRGTVEAGRDVALDVDVVLEGRVVLGDGVTIGPFCRLRDVVLAAGTRVHAHCDLDGVTTTGAALIGPYARLRPGTELAEGVHIGNFVETKKARLGRGSKANHLSYLGDTEIGSGVNVGAGTITCNYDGVNKFTTRIEDGAFIGSNTALVAPVTVGKDATIGAGSTINKNAPAGELTLTRAPQHTVPGWKRPTKRP